MDKIARFERNVTILDHSHCIYRLGILKMDPTRLKEIGKEPSDPKYAPPVIQNNQVFKILPLRSSMDF